MPLSVGWNSVLQRGYLFAGRVEVVGIARTVGSELMKRLENEELQNLSRLLRGRSKTKNIAPDEAMRRKLQVPFLPFKSTHKVPSSHHKIKL